MWTIINRSIESTTPTYRQQSVDGSTTICRTDEPRFIFGNKNKKSRKVKTGVVKGGVLSSALLYYYLADFPTPPPNIKLIKYADDITTYTSGPVVADQINGLSIYLSQVLNYINNKKLTVSTEKYTVTLFTPHTLEHHLHQQVKVADQVLPLEKKSKVLGVTLVTHLTFTQHCNNIAVKVQQRNNVFKTLVGCDLGLRQRNLANDLSGNWPLNTQLLLPSQDAITYGH